MVNAPSAGTTGGEWIELKAGVKGLAYPYTLSLECAMLQTV